MFYVQDSTVCKKALNAADVVVTQAANRPELLPAVGYDLFRAVLLATINRVRTMSVSK
jgi:hypothetical protein